MLKSTFKIKLLTPLAVSVPLYLNRFQYELILAIVMAWFLLKGFWFSNTELQKKIQWMAHNNQENWLTRVIGETLFRKKTSMLNEMFQQNTWICFLFLLYRTGYFNFSLNKWWPYVDCPVAFYSSIIL